MSMLERGIKEFTNRLFAIEEKMRGWLYGRWAVVTSTRPLRIKFDTANEPIQGTPSTLVPGLTTGDRVYVLMQNHRALIVGRANPEGSEPQNGDTWTVLVDSFGAVGDGETDDTAAIQAAVDTAQSFGGGTVVFSPKKTYMVDDFVRLHPGTHIRGYGATITKPRTGRGSVAFFAIQTGKKRGYGAGGRDFIIEGITTHGHANVGHSATLLSAHHARDVVIRNCVGILSVGRGHWVDLNGCDGVLVEDCTLWGAANAVNTIPGEAVQADISAPGSMSVQEDTDEGYDRLPSRNVTVSRTKFRQYTFEGRTYPAPVAFGSHTSPLAGTWYKNLRFVDNECEPTQEKTSGVRGVVRFVSSDGVVIRGNKFFGGDVNQVLISIQPGYDDGNEVTSKNIVIEGNFTEAAGTSHMYFAVGDCITVTGNTLTGFGIGNDPKHGIFVGSSPTQFAITGNTFKRGTGRPQLSSYAINLNGGANAAHGTIAANISDLPYGGNGWSDGRVVKVGNIPTT